jgi:antitoxin component YwqK of YwqJK toxin-antitoxin module
MSTIDPPTGFTGVWTSPRQEDGWDEWTCVDGAKTGPWRRFLRDGSVQRECELVDGHFHGVLITRGSSGQILDQSPFTHGTGVYRIFTSDDRLAWEIPVRGGRRHGVVRRLCNGVWIEEAWRDGVCVSHPQ